MSNFFIAYIFMVILSKHSMYKIQTYDWLIYKLNLKIIHLHQISIKNLLGNNFLVQFDDLCTKNWIAATKKDTHFTLKSLLVSFI